MLQSHHNLNGVVFFPKKPNFAGKPFGSEKYKFFNKLHRKEVEKKLFFIRIHSNLVNPKGENMAHLLFPIGDTEAITAEIRLAAREFCARINQKDLVAKVGPNESRGILPRRIILDDGTTVEIVREPVFPGMIWLGVKGDLTV